MEEPEMLSQVKETYDALGPQVAKKMNERFFEAYYVSTKEEALAKALELIGKDDLVSWGGTVTVDQVGLKEALYARGQKMLDRDKAASPEERVEILHKALGCDYFLMSSNAISADGQMVNIDGTGNRVAALCYGPRNILVIAGMNKVTPDLDSAVKRARNVAAPVNSFRFPALKTPCKIAGKCVDCKGETSICAQFVTTRICKPAGRIKVILVGEDLGF
ncbi:MAG: lactate utilization protein [Firmicutes bacterium]|nr:lactate utilization protein [Bacillota bacterium]